MNHTPGPWKVIQPNDSIERFAVITETLPHRSITGWGNVRQLEGDAYLIAAAPDLLEALEAVGWVQDEELPNDCYCPWCGNYEHRGHASDCSRQAAIAKARGGP